MGKNDLSPSNIDSELEGLREKERVLSESLEEWEKSYTNLLKSNPDAVLILADRIVLYVNDATLKLFNIKTRNKLIGQTLNKSIPKDLFNAIKKAIKNVEKQKNKILPYETTYINEHGQLIDVEIQIRPIYFWGKGAQQLIIKDISTRKRKETEIQQKREDLNLINFMHDLVNKGATLTELISQMGKETKRIFSANGASVFLLSEDKKFLVLQAIFLKTSLLNKIEQYIGTKIPEVRVSLESDTVYKNILMEGKPKIINSPVLMQKAMSEFTDVKRIKKMVPLVYKVLGYESFMIIPLVAKDQIIGMMDIGRKVVFTESDLERFTHFSTQLICLIRHVQVKEELKKSEEIYKKLFDQSLDPIVVIEDGKIIQANPAVSTLVAMPLEKVIGKTPLDFIYPDDHESASQRIRILLSGQELPEKDNYRVRRPDGSIRWIEVRSRPFHWGKVNRFMTILKDITEELEIKQSLEKSEKKFRKFFEHSTDYCYMISGKMEILDVNRAALHALEYEKAQLVGKSFENIFTRESQKRLKDNLHRLQKTGAIENLELDIQTKTGKEKGILLSTFEVKGDQGKTYHLFSVQRDISDLRVVKKELESSEANYKNLFEQSMDAILVVGNNRIVEVNQVAVDFFKTKPETLMKINPLDLLHPKSRGMGKERLKLVAEGQELGPGKRYEVLLPDGTSKWVNVRTKPFSRNNLIHILVIFRDITEEIKIEEEMQKKEKLESLGVLAGGIAHDFNNLLTGIIGNIGMARLYLNPEDNTFKILETAEKTAIQAKALTNQLLTFAKGGVLNKKTLLIKNMVKNISTFALRGSNAKCELNIEEKLWYVKIDIGQMEQVISNLIINAHQAMPEGGLIKIKVENYQSKTKGPVSIPKGKFVRISIRDEGMGIPEKYIHKVFDPYFTTKKEGSGLGLAVSYSIMKKHNGYLLVNSWLGKGTQFDIYIPAAKNQKAPQESDKKNMKTRTFKVLVMDDDEIVRDVLGKMLTYLGGKVTDALEGSTAIKKFQNALKSKKAFDIVILDLIIPGGLGGVETAKKMLAMEPTAKIFACSGYSNDPVIDNFRKYGFSDVLIKPFEIEKLSDLLDKHLKSTKKT